MSISLSEETFRNLEREPLTLSDGRKFRLLEVSIKALAVPVGVEPSSDGTIPVYELYFEPEIVDGPIASESDSEQNVLSLTGHFVEAELDDSILAETIGNVLNNR